MISQGAPPGPSQEGTQSSNLPRQPSVYRISRPYYLILVFPDTRYASKADQFRATTIYSDFDFFRTIRDRYKQFRDGFRFSPSVRTLVDIRFVKFHLRQRARAHVRLNDDLPPLTMKDVYSYEPSDFSPPISREEMIHYVSDPAGVDPGTMYFSRVPRS